MLDERVVRERRKQVQESLKALDAERLILQNMLAADEAWLALNGHIPSTPDGPADGRRSTKDIVLEVLREHTPIPVHASVIWDQAAHKGARSDATDPVKMVDSLLREVAKTILEVVPSGNRSYAWDPKAPMLARGYEDRILAARDEMEKP